MRNFLYYVFWRILVYQSSNENDEQWISALLSFSAFPIVIWVCILGYVDKIFLNSQIIKKEENLCILVCLMISSKINEKKHKNLTASQIIHILEYEFSFDEILKYELHISKTSSS